VHRRTGLPGDLDGAQVGQRPVEHAVTGGGDARRRDERAAAPARGGEPRHRGGIDELAADDRMRRGGAAERGERDDQPACRPRCGGAPAHGSS
jgi:hypothetical protein